MAAATGTILIRPGRAAGWSNLCGLWSRWVKYRLLEFLQHPQDAAPFDIEVYESRDLIRTIDLDAVSCSAWCHRKKTEVAEVKIEDCQACYNHEIMAGKLTATTTGAEYPIVAGVPRILPAELLKERLEKNHASFLEKYGDRFKASTGFTYVIEKEKSKTADAFGYQWNTFVDNYDYFRDIFLSFTRPYMDADDFQGKVCLEVGCGSGRPAVTACRLGAEVIGMDISEAVEAAYIQTEKAPFFHVVQADAYSPPFNQKFDVVYSVGVLQHIPSPKKALQGIQTTLSQQSPLILWIYGKREFWYQPIEWSRAITRRIPVKLLHGISIVLAALSELLLLVPYRILSRIPFTKALAEKIPGRIYAKYPFRENVVGWFDRLVAPVTYYFEKDQILSLLDETGFDNIKIHARKDASASWVIQAHRKTGT
jgi:SAM-dependent methyltransferase/uncharacterized protein YbaR (Trm112 family)